MKHDSVVHDKAYNVPVQPDAFIEKNRPFSRPKEPGADKRPFPGIGSSLPVYRFFVHFFSASPVKSFSALSLSMISGLTGFGIFVPVV